jgi:hypothetical protein
LDVDTIVSDKRTYRISLTTQSRDIWVNYDGAWMLKRTEEIDTKFTVDEKSQQ